MTIRINIGLSGLNTGISAESSCVCTVTTEGGTGGSGGSSGGGGTGGGGGLPEANFNPAPWTENLTLTQYTANTGVNPLCYINFNDSSTATFGAQDDTSPVVITYINDKTSNDHDFDNYGNPEYVIKSGRNIALSSIDGYFYNSTLATALSGNVFTKPYYVAIPFEPTTFSAVQTLWSLGHTSTGAYRTLDITTSGYLQLTWKDDSGNTGTVTSSTPLELNVRTIVLIHIERERVRIFAHNGSGLDNRYLKSGSSGTNAVATYDKMFLGAKYEVGVQSQPFLGYIEGLIIAEGVFTNTFTLLANLANLWSVGYINPNASDLSSNLVSHLAFSGPAGDHVDIITGSVASHTSPLITTGVFDNAIHCDGSTRPLYVNANATYDLTNKTQYTIGVRFKPLTAGSGVQQQILDFWTDVGNCWYIRQRTTNQIQFIIFQSDHTTFQGDTYTGTVNFDVWNYYFLWTNDGVTWFHSLNGGAEESFTRSGGVWSAIAEANPKLWIGSNNSAGSIGRSHIDDISIWTKILTTAEKTEYYNGGNYREFPYQYTVTGGGGSGQEPPTTSTEYYWGSQVTGYGPSNAPILKGQNTYITFTCPPGVTKLEHVSFWWKSNYNPNSTYVNSQGQTVAITPTPNTYSKGEPSSWKYSVILKNDSSGVPGTAVTNGTIANIQPDPGSPNAQGTYVIGGQKMKHSFATPPTVTPGTKYHVVFENTSSGSTNWCSLNGIEGPANNSITRPTQTTNSWNLILNGTARSINPDAVLWFDAGVRYGNPYLDCEYQRKSSSTSTITYNSPIGIGGANLVRQKLTPDTSITLKKLWVACRRTAGTADLTARIVTVAGTTLSTIVIPSSFFPLNDTMNWKSYTDAPKISWGFADLPTPLAITGGTTYYLELSSTSGTNYLPAILYSGSSNAAFPTDTKGRYGGFYGLNAPAQKTANAGLNWSNLSYGSASQLSFYFLVS